MGFKNAFSEENENELEVGPKAWQSYINANAPENFHYEYIGSSQYQLIPDTGKLEFKTIVTLPDDLKHIKLNGVDDFNKLIYRSQRILEIKIPEIKANQQSISLDELVVGFSSYIKHEHDKFFLIPQPFSQPITIPLKMNNKEYFLKFQQMPYPSLTKIIFESIDKSIFHFKLTFHEDKEKMDIQLNYNFSNAKSLEYIIENKQMITDFSTGNIELFNYSTSIFNEDLQIEIQKILSFFIKLDKIKIHFQGKFDIKKNISTLDAYNLQRMYYSFIDNKYYYDNEKVSQYKMVATNEVNFPEDLSAENKFAMIGFTPQNITILGQSLQLAEQFSFKVASYSTKNKSKLQEGDSIYFNVEGDQIIYKKLMYEPNDSLDFNDVQKELDTAVEIDIEKI